MVSASPSSMELHGGPISPFVRKVTLVIAEKGLVDQVTFRRSPTAMATVNAPLSRFNPLSKIPTLVTATGKVIADSDVICEYLAASYPPAELIPPVGQSRWDCLTRTAMASGVLDALVLLRFQQNLPASQQSPETIAALKVKIEATLKLLDRDELGDPAGVMNLADLTTGTVLGYLDFRFAENDWRASYRRLADWSLGFSERRSAQVTAPYEHRPGVEKDPALSGRLMWE
jgi:glutathione S-transferase